MIRQWRLEVKKPIRLEFDMAGPTEATIGYAELICHKFNLLDS
jgi:hypothetical protein